MPPMGMRVAFLAAECEPWAKTGGLADVVDALARALGHLGDAIDPPVDVYLPRYRSVPEPAPDATLGATTLAVPDPRAPTGSSTLTIVDVAADGYRLRLVDHPPAFDRAGLLYITCYTPAAIYRAGLDGKAELLIEDWEAHMLSNPTNIAFGGEKFDQLFAANLGRWHITKIDVRAKGAPLG